MVQCASSRPQFEPRMVIYRIVNLPLGLVRAWASLAVSRALTADIVHWCATLRVAPCISRDVVAAVLLTSFAVQCTRSGGLL